MKYMTKKAAQEVINREKDLHETNYLCGDLKASDMKEMLRCRMRFDEAETNFILAALVSAGAKFIVD